MTTNQSLLLLLATTSLLGACVAEDEEEADPIDESFLGAEGKDDAFGIRDGSPEAVGILQLANTGRRRDLRDRVRLSADAIANIYAHRADELAFPDPFNDLRELDDVPYVGQGTFTKLLAYAQANRYVSPEPFDPAICSGAPITLSALQTLTANGTRPLPTGATWTRSRPCSGVLGCGAWTAGAKLGAPENSQIKFRDAENNRLYFDVGFARTETRPDGRLSLDAHTVYAWSFYLSFANESSQIQPAGIPRYHFDFGSNVTSDVTLVDVTTKLTGSCLRVSGRMPSTPTYPTEREVVFLSQF